MEPVLTSAQLREADAYTIAHEPISSVDLMERAATACTSYIAARIETGRLVKVFCGTGNNGGDGLAIARLLLAQHYVVQVYVVRHSDKTSDDFSTNYQRLQNIDPAIIFDIRTSEDLPVMAPGDIIIDALLGTGLNRPPQDIMAEVISHINVHHAFVMAIDMPGGLYTDSSSLGHRAAIVRAKLTLTLQVPKLALLLPENGMFTGELTVLDIGLNRDFMAAAHTQTYVVTRTDVQRMLKPRDPFSHKGTYGHALIVAGSYGKAGAAVLSAKAALRSGAGLVSAHVPRCAYNILQTAVPEVMTIADENELYLERSISYGAYAAIGIGPGIGTEAQTQQMLKLMVQQYKGPLVFDADALNILAGQKTWLGFLPAGSVLTPHPKEFARLFGEAENDFTRLDLLRASAMKYGVYIVLKGRYTCMATPGGYIYINSTGNPGMATGGTGDVLTGILTGLLAQDYTPLDAMLTGVYIHGLAGDIGLQHESVESLTAGDIIENLGAAFTHVRSPLGASK